jgi:hypothetical protein
MLFNIKKILNVTVKKKIKNTYHYSIALFDILKIILLIKNIDKKVFFIRTEGGFGPTITTSHLLNLHYKTDWILLFGTKNERHNKKISIIFEDRIKFFRCGDLNRVENCDKFEKFISKILRFFFKIDLISTSEYIFNLNIESYKNKFSNIKLLEKNKFLLFESGFFFKKKIEDLYLNNPFKKKFSEKFEKFGSNSNFRGRINFFLRGKGKKYPNNRFIDQLRDSRNIEDYKPSIECLVDHNWQIFLTGELFEIPNWIKNMNNSVIFHQKTNLTLDDFNLYVLPNSQIYIGGSSGPPLFSCLSNCKNLLLETSHLGIGYLDTVVSYPKINFKDLSELKEIFLRCPFDNQYLEDVFKSGLIKKLTSNELQEITNEFISNYSNSKVWKTPQSLNIEDGQLYYLDSKISNFWLKLHGIN